MSNPSQSQSSSLSKEKTKYNDQYMSKDMAMIQNQTFSIQDLPELSDIKCLAEFYRYLFKEFTCTYVKRNDNTNQRGDVIRIKYKLLTLEELDDDLDYDEIHYTRISSEFERILGLYVKEACVNLNNDIEVYDKDDFMRLYEYTNNGRLKYSESFCT